MLTNATKLRYHTCMTDSTIVPTLKNLGLRLTRTRIACISLFEKTDGPVDAETLIKTLRVNKTTIYRELSTLLSEKLISEIDFGDGKKRYELTSKEHHHHLIFMKCKSVSEYIVITDLSKEEKNIKDTKKFTVLKHALEFFGYCQKCTQL